MFGMLIVALITMTPDKITIRVTGEVLQPGQYELAEHARILNALSAAGGPVEASSDLRRVILRRHSSKEEIPINIARMLNAGNLGQNLELKDGDILIVPKLERRYVWFDSGGSSLYQLPYSSGMTLGEALQKVGWSPSKDTEVLRLERPGLSPQAASLVFEFPAILVHTGPNPPASIGLREGDIIHCAKGSVHALPGS